MQRRVAIFRPLILLILFLALPTWAQEIIRLQSDEVAMVAYGSLMNKESLEKSLGEKYKGPFLDIELNGWKRSWDVAMPNEAFYTETAKGKVIPKSIVYLNITPDKNTNMNAVLFVIKRKDLESFNRREWIYDPTELSKSLKGAKVEGGQVLAYVAKPEYLVLPDATFPEVAVRQTYVETVEEALRKKGSTHLELFHGTTDELPKFVIKDMVDPKIDVFGYKKVEAKAKQSKTPYSQCLKSLLIQHSVPSPF